MPCQGKNVGLETNNWTTVLLPDVLHQYEDILFKSEIVRVYGKTRIMG